MMPSARLRRPTSSYLLIYGSALVICTFSLIPILWGVSTSLKTDAKVYSIPPAWVPEPVTFENYWQVFTNSAMLRYFKNTAIVSFSSMAISLVIGVLGAYGFSRYRFPGAKTLLASILFTRVLPRVTLIVPFYITLRNLRMLNTYQGMILIYLMVVMPISVWLLKGFFDNVPYEIEEAAIVDGCSPLGLLTRVVLPLSTPAIAAVGMYSFILAWNEFLFALLVSTDATTRTISVGLAFFIDEAGIHWGPLMAASILMSIPAVIVFTLSQRLLVKGLSEGSVKG
jgi:ABC-type glycerol-3-phosphate transport system permease component